MGSILRSVLQRGSDPLRKCVPSLYVDCSHGHGAMNMSLEVEHSDRLALSLAAWL